MKIRIGSRASGLARVQAAHIAALLARRFPELRAEFVFIKTSGDRENAPVSKLGGKGIFVKEIESALIDGSIDIAVHSLKDLPSVLPDGLIIGAVPKREDPSDCLVIANRTGGADFESLKKGAKIATASARRACQILNLRPDVSPEPVHGSIETRIAKMESGSFDALMLATAALRRLGMENRIAQKFDPNNFIPSPGQGALAVECRRDGAKILSALKTIECERSRLCAEVERAFLRKIGGDCQIAAGCYAEKKGEKIKAVAMMASGDGTKIYRQTFEADEKLGAQAGEMIAEKILKRLQRADIDQTARSV